MGHSPVEPSNRGWGSFNPKPQTHTLIWDGEHLQEFIDNVKYCTTFLSQLTKKMKHLSDSNKIRYNDIH